MKTNCIKCRKNTENIDPKMVRTKNNRLIGNQNVLFAKLRSQDL